MSIKVASTTNPKQLAGAIYAEITKNDRIELEMIGADAVNQAVRAIAIARGFVSASMLELVTLPEIGDRAIGGNRSVMKLVVEARQTNPFVLAMTSPFSKDADKDRLLVALCAEVISTHPNKDQYQRAFIELFQTDQKEPVVHA